MKRTKAHMSNELCLHDMAHKVLPHITLFYNKTYLWCAVKPEEVV